MAGYFSKPFYIIPIYAVAMIGASQLLPSNGSGEAVRSVDVQITKIERAHSLKYSHGGRSIYSVRYQVPNKEGQLISYKDKIRISRAEYFHVHGNIRVNDEIEAFYFPSKPKQVFLNSDWPNQYRLYLQLGMVILVLWIFSYLVYKKEYFEQI